jgi:Restriction endonuclease
MPLRLAPAPGYLLFLAGMARFYYWDGPIRRGRPCLIRCNDEDTLTVVPHRAKGAAMTQSDSTLLAGEVERARREVNKLISEKRLFQSQIARRALKSCRLALCLYALRFVLLSRQLTDRSVTRIGGVCIGLTLVAGLFVAVAYDASAGPARYLLMATAGTLFAAVVSVLFLKEDSSLYASAYSIGLRRDEIAEQWNRLALQYSDKQRQLKSARAEYDRLNGILTSRLYKLRTCRWDLKTGTEFEHFLAEVFNERGYVVELTGKSGDQGVDLVIIRDGIRIAIQAKGYPSGSVGNGAVQEVHTGMAIYSCQMSAVVTNSHFTVGARELAQSVGCRLIDGSQIPDLIDGRILL